MKVLKKVSNILCVLGLCTLMGGTSYAWDGKKDGSGTHGLIVEQGLNMIKNDLSGKESQQFDENLYYLFKYSNDLKLGSTYPDFDPNAYKLYQDHFYDPDTGNNFTVDNKWYLSYKIEHTAETQVRKFTALAKNEWEKGNYKEAAYLLGQAMHYLGDINNPYHASNVTAVDFEGVNLPGHIEYERFVENKKNNYALDTSGGDTTSGVYKEAMENSNFNNWMTQNSVKYAKKAKDLYKFSTMSNSNEDWDYSGREAVKNSQLCTAGFLYRFINEVSGNSGKVDTLSNEFNIVLKTADNQYAGTNDNVYFGFETNDGKRFQWKLDNPGDDFERNQIDSYILKTPNGEKVDINNISKYWITKEKVTAISDDWELSNFKLISNSNVILEKDVNKIFKGNETYYINK
ncbi:phospholipase C [Paraclostridium ghonii]|uniref:phospholipase C n=1 Tax=Paraclostridium ghonii TaxID=29358 RepID=UPI00202CE197|nr:phospholipase C [Paeniclostridium ghonii]MCM0165222.1 zinc dependent phospholipase C family protein [Paeniclostridium ghonii]